MNGVRQFNGVLRQSTTWRLRNIRIGQTPANVKPAWRCRARVFQLHMTAEAVDDRAHDGQTQARAFSAMLARFALVGRPVKGVEDALALVGIDAGPRVDDVDDDVRAGG